MHIEDIDELKFLPHTRGDAITRQAGTTHVITTVIDDELEGLRARAGRMAAIEGVSSRAAVAAPSVKWRILSGAVLDRDSNRFDHEPCDCGVERFSWTRWEVDKHSGAERECRSGASLVVHDFDSVISFGAVLPTFGQPLEWVRG